jgi:molecular chaperone GrpE
MGFTDRFKKNNSSSENEKTTQDNKNNSILENEMSDSNKTGDENKENDLQERINNISKENNELKQKIESLMYIIANKENIIKKMENDIKEQSKISLRKFVKSTGVAIDDLVRILEKTENDALKMVLSKLFKAFEENNITIYKPQVGDEFNPEMHNAVSSIKHNEMKTGQIAQSMSSCYKVFDTTILNAMVIVVDNETE